MPRLPWSARISPGADRSLAEQHARKRTPRRVLGALVAIAGALMPAIALAKTARPSWNPGPPWAPLAPASPEMHHISDLFWLMLGISGVIFLGVCGALIYSIVNFTGKEGDAEPKQVFGNRTVEIVWTVIPTIILLVAFGFTVSSIHSINAAPTGKVLQVDAIGHQWWWEFRYPGLGVVTANEVHLPTGSRIHFHVESNDVIHSFWIPQITRQIDANPGQDNAVFAKLDRTGVFGGDCYEYCGASHAWMKFRAVVQSPAQFAAWTKHEQSAATSGSASTTSSGSGSSASIAAGRKVFLANTCIECHAINGTSAGGIVGPNLTHLASRWTIGAGVLPMDKKDLISWIQHPSSYKEGVEMPGYPFLSKKQISDLADYLLSLK